MITHQTEQQLAQLRALILDLLQCHSGGIREFDLMEALARRGVAHYDRPAGVDQLSMFQRHFLLFHCLYRLRDELREQAVGELEIHCLNIVIVPLGANSSTSNLPQPSDPLRDYYLDLDNLVQTRAEDVAALIDQFWQRFVFDEQRQAALNVLGLAGEASFDEIKSRYRRLAMEHHPDRGGDTERLQAINRAMEQLKASAS